MAALRGDSLGPALPHEPASRDELVIAAVAYVSDPTWLVQPLCLLEALPDLGPLDVTVAPPLVRAMGTTFQHRLPAAAALAADELDFVSSATTPCLDDLTKWDTTVPLDDVGRAAADAMIERVIAKKAKLSPRRQRRGQEL